MLPTGKDVASDQSGGMRPPGIGQLRALWFQPRLQMQKSGHRDSQCHPSTRSRGTELPRSPGPGILSRCQVVESVPQALVPGQALTDCRG